MHSATVLAAVVAGLFGWSSAFPLVVHPGNANDIVITAQDTLNGTLIGGTTGTQKGEAANIAAGNAQMTVAFKNNFGAGSVNAYIQGQDTSGDIVFVLSDGSFYYPPSTTSTTPTEITANLAIPLGAEGSSTSLTLPGYISSGRIYIADGTLKFYVVDAGGNTGLVQPSITNPSDPNANVNYGFAEFTNNDSGIYADVSYVDFVGIPLGLSLQSTDGSQNVEGVSSTAISNVCSALKSQAAADGAPWDQLCVTDGSGNLVRVIAPIDYISVENSAFGDYWTDYVNQVWNYYTTNTLTIDTQTGDGQVACTVVSGTLTCAGDNRGYAQPAAVDIFGCNSGPFAIQADDNSIHRAIVPRLCAAFNRSTLLLSGGSLQPSLPSGNYYTVSPTNYFSKFVHQVELDGLGYAFSYDDVTPDGGPSAAGLVSDGNPEVLTITVGGPSS